MTILCKCGQPNADGALFCRSPTCGELLEWSAPAPTGVGGASPEAQVATAVQAPPRLPAPEKEKRPEYLQDDVPERPPQPGDLFCLNPECPSPRNPPFVRYCRGCGKELELELQPRAAAGRDSKSYLNEGMPEGATAKRGSYNPHTEYLASRYVQHGDLVALRPKRDGDPSDTYTGDYVPARPPNDNIDPGLVWAPAQVEQRESGGTRVNATDPDGVSVPLPESEVIVKAPTDYLPSRYVQHGELVALRPKRDGDPSDTFTGDYVPARPPNDNTDPGLVWAPAQVEQRESGGTRVNATDPDGVSVPLPESEVIVRAPSEPGRLARFLVVGWLVALVVAAVVWFVFRPLGIVGAAVLVLVMGGLGVLVFRFVRAHRPEKELPAGVHERPRRRLLGKDLAVLLNTWLKVLAVVVIVGAAAIGGLWAWNSTLKPRAADLYASSREALFPRYRSVGPHTIFYVQPNLCSAGVRPARQRKELSRSPLPAKLDVLRRKNKNPPRKPCYPVKSTHSVADIFDKNLDTFWLSPTKLGANDLIVVRFDPAVDIAAFTVFAGDPTGAQAVPKNIQMTFYGPAQTVYYAAPVDYPPPGTTARTLPRTTKRLYWPVLAVREWTLLDTQAEQPFSTGDRTNIARVVITIRGHYPNPNRDAKQALTEVEFFDKY